MFFLFKQKTVYEMRISDWSADVCSSDLAHVVCQVDLGRSAGADGSEEPVPPAQDTTDLVSHAGDHHGSEGIACPVRPGAPHPAAMADVGGPPDTLVAISLRGALPWTLIAAAGLVSVAALVECVVVAQRDELTRGLRAGLVACIAPKEQSGSE